MLSQCNPEFVPVCEPKIIKASCHRPKQFQRHSGALPPSSEQTGHSGPNVAGEGQVYDSKGSRRCCPQAAGCTRRTASSRAVPGATGWRREEGVFGPEPRCTHTRRRSQLLSGQAIGHGAGRRCGGPVVLRRCELVLRGRGAGRGRASVGAGTSGGHDGGGCR